MARGRPTGRRDLTITAEIACPALTSGGAAVDMKRPQPARSLADLFARFGIQPGDYESLAHHLAVAGGHLRDESKKLKGGRRKRWMAKRALARRFREFAKQHPGKSLNQIADAFIQHRKKLLRRSQIEFPYKNRKTLLKAVHEGEALLRLRRTRGLISSMLQHKRGYRNLEDDNTRLFRQFGTRAVLGLQADIPLKKIQNSK